MSSTGRAVARTKWSTSEFRTAVSFRPALRDPGPRIWRQSSAGWTRLDVAREHRTKNATARQRQDLNADHADYADLSEPRDGLTARRRQSEGLWERPLGRPGASRGRSRERRAPTGRTACSYATRGNPRNRRNLE